AGVGLRLGGGLADPPRRLAYLYRAALGGDRGSGRTRRHRGEGCPGAAAGGLPPRRLPGRRRGLRLQGDRRDHGHPVRHGGVAAAPWSRTAAAALGRSRSVVGDEGGEGMTEEIRPEGCRCEEALEHLYEYLDAEMSDVQLSRLRAHIEECTTCLDDV